MSSAAQSAAARPAAGTQKTALMEREQASAFLYDLLRLMIAKDGSDLFLTVDFPPAFKISGKMVPVSAKATACSIVSRSRISPSMITSGA